MNTIDQIPIIVGISGGSGSGKTEISQRLMHNLAPLSVNLITEDSYYNDYTDDPGFDAGRFNFDHPDTRDHFLLIEHLNNLKSGLAVNVPTYDFSRHCRTPATTRITTTDIILVEGIHLFCTPALMALFNTSVYVHASDDVRLARRIRRDVDMRGRTIETVLKQYFQTVRPMHKIWTEPGRDKADIIIENDEMDLELDKLFGHLCAPLVQNIQKQIQSQPA